MAKQSRYEKDYWSKPENKARKKRNARNTYLRHKEKILRRSREARLVRDYGISIEDYEEMLAEQNGVCLICGSKPGTKRSKRLHVDHCHTTGRVRGLLCQKCNHMLGLAGDNPEVLRIAASYLENV
jgi:hypothetical protein